MSISTTATLEVVALVVVSDLGSPFCLTCWVGDFWLQLTVANAISAKMIVFLAACFILYIMYYLRGGLMCIYRSFTLLGLSILAIASCDSTQPMPRWRMALLWLTCVLTKVLPKKILTDNNISEIATINRTAMKSFISFSYFCLLKR